jgi:hypothetical protein
VDLAAVGTRSGGDVFRAQLSVEAALEGGDFLGGVLAEPGAVVGEGVEGGGVVAVLITWAGGVLVGTWPWHDRVLLTEALSRMLEVSTGSGGWNEGVVEKRGAVLMPLWSRRDVQVAGRVGTTRRKLGQAPAERRARERGLWLCRSRRIASCM